MTADFYSYLNESGSSWYLPLGLLDQPLYRNAVPVHRPNTHYVRGTIVYSIFLWISYTPSSIPWAYSSRATQPLCGCTRCNILTCDYSPWLYIYIVYIYTASHPTHTTHRPRATIFFPLPLAGFSIGREGSTVIFETSMPVLDDNCHIHFSLLCAARLPRTVKTLSEVDCIVLRTTLSTSLQISTLLPKEWGSDKATISHTDTVRVQ